MPPPSLITTGGRSITEFGHVRKWTFHLDATLTQEHLLAFLRMWKGASSCNASWGHIGCLDDVVVFSSVLWRIHFYILFSDFFFSTKTDQVTGKDTYLKIFSSLPMQAENRTRTNDGSKSWKSWRVSQTRRHFNPLLLPLTTSFCSHQVILSFVETGGWNILFSNRSIRFFRFM